MVIQLVGHLLCQRGGGWGKLVGPELLQERVVGPVRFQRQQADPPCATFQVLLTDKQLLRLRGPHKVSSSPGIVGQLHQKLDQWLYLPVLPGRENCILNFIYQNQPHMVGHTENLYLGGDSGDGDGFHQSQTVQVIGTNGPVQGC